MPEFELSVASLIKKIASDLVACDNKKDTTRYLADALGNLQYQSIILSQYDTYISEWITKFVPTKNRPLTPDEFFASRTMKKEEFEQYMNERGEEVNNEKPRIILLGP